VIRDITVRKRRAGDGAEMARAWLDTGRYYAALEPETFQVPEADGLAEYLEREEAAEAGPDVIRLVAEVEGRVVGAALGRIERPGEGARYQLQREFSETRLLIDVVIVEETYRRHGVGQALMGVLEDWGRERGAAVALLDTYPETGLFLPFFTERMGYLRRSVRLWRRL
jgi:GNAT superfamily N-acetyltransferase